ncbi:MAG: class 1 fructose-bisphosphatase [Thermoplasmatota archaeon]
MLAIAAEAGTIRKGFLTKQGLSNTVNIYGETQVKMDKWADEVIVNALSQLPSVTAVASEERPEIVGLSDSGRFSVVMDPLDGSSLMGINLTVGTIVGIFDSPDPLIPGSGMAAALYILYGPLTTLTYSVGKGVHEFAMTEEGRFLLQHEDLTIGESKIYSPGALRKDWLPPHRRFIDRLEADGYKLRFCGSFVADVHQILHKGGVFTYPAFAGKENGKLRLLFEANPMGFIVANAGGAISNGRENILDIRPESLDQRVPIYVGGKKEIRIIEDEWSRG